MGNKIINWKEFYYVPIKIFIIEKCPNLYSAWKWLIISFIEYKERFFFILIKLQTYYNNLNYQIDNWDNYFTLLVNELYSLILHIIGQPFLYLSYKINNFIYTYFYFVIEWVYIYRYKIIFYSIILLNFFVNYTYNYVLYSIFCEVIANSNNQYVIIADNIQLIDHSIKEDFSHLDYITAAYAGYVIAEIFFAVLLEITTLTSMAILMPWFTLFACASVLSSQIKEPERCVVLNDHLADTAIFVIENLLKIFKIM